MAELCVKLNDQSNDDVYADARCYKRGDVVAIQEDGWQWGPAERGGDLMVIKVPGVPVEALTAFIVEEPGDKQTDTMLQRRAFRLDLDEFLRAPSDLTFADTERLKKMKAKRPDPNVFGGDSKGRL